MFVGIVSAVLLNGVGLPSQIESLKPANEIKASNKTFDFSGKVFRGTSMDTPPDQRKGLGFRVTGNNITIKNLKVHGYKVGLIAENCKNLKLINCDFSDNWKQHLKSTTEKEDLADWMSFHENEKDEWLRYGAGVYLKDVNNFEVKNCTITGGQCGLMMMRANQGVIWNNNFSFLSGIGVGMYRASNNRIMHNNIDWCVRGHSEGVYNRGQDSAGILVYEQSNKNVFAYNSVTHGGDGFFLWAGQSTMDTGKGGCNDNLVYGNDFSHAPTNGIEATFSRNKFVNNRLHECWHGFWTGYSYESLIAGNDIRNCGEGIAHEHGYGNVVDTNNFMGNGIAMRIWANEKQDPNWGYPKIRNTKSENWRIEGNQIWGKALDVKRTTGLIFTENTTFNATFSVAADSLGVQFIKNCLHSSLPNGGVPEGVESIQNECEEAPASRAGMDLWSSQDNDDVWGDDSPDEMKGGKSPFFNLTNTDALKPRGRKYIMMSEWGPYDFQRPLLWKGPVTANGLQKFSIYGPKGKWKLVESKGVKATTQSGSVPGSILVQPEAGGDGNQTLVLEYVGKEIKDDWGRITPAGKPVRFDWRRFDVVINWDVKFFSWDKDSSDPRTNLDAYNAGKSKVLVSQKTTKLEYAGYKFAEGMPANHFGTEADGSFTIAPGEYTVDVTADDGLRVSLDGKNIIDAWKYQAPTNYTATVKLGGKHKIHVEHFQIDGYATLQLKIRPKVVK